MKVYHVLEPVYDENSKVLILGSIPSVKSRDVGFYYSHPQNRFWKTLSLVYEVEIGNSIEERKKFCLDKGIALFDVLKSCDIVASSDNTIKNAVPNDLEEILHNSKIEIIFTTGRKAFDLYNKLIFPKVKKKAIYLPSTSPAHAGRDMQMRLVKEYQIIKKYTEKS